MCHRYITDNPGAWLLHCHVQWHLVVSRIQGHLDSEADRLICTERDGSGAY